MSKPNLRSKILALLEKHREGLTLGKIQSELEVKRRERAKLLEDLRELEGARLVRSLKSRYVLSPKTGVVRGRFVTSRRGFGFVTPQAGGEDIFIPARFAEGVLQGDEVEVLVKESGRFGKPEGKVVRIVERERKTILGLYKEQNGAPFIQAFDSPSPADIPLRAKGRPAPEPGMVIEADRKSLAVSRIYGRPEDPGVDTQVIIRRYGLAAGFSDETLLEAGRIPGALAPPDFEGRRDFRDWPTVTIDGEKAQDFDDAVSVRRLEGGRFLLGVHIADVSHYVKPGTALDTEALERATSVYFPDLTLPMIPEKLSNDLCSLRPAVPRLTVSALMEIDGEGRVLSSEFAPSVIRTVERMTYTSVFKVLEGDEIECRRYAPLVGDFLLMRDLARTLRARRVEQGSLDFDLVEPELIYEEGKLMAVAAAERNEAHRLIEEFMVAANVAVASFLTAKEIPSIYRVHPVPAVADLEKLREILLRFGYALPEPGKIRSRDLDRVLLKAEGRPEEKFVSIQVLRAMKLAVYSPENVGHYGLGKADYTHFTSPIRRYPDLAVHRILKSVLATGESLPVDLDGVARHSSERERNADEAEKALLEWRIFRLLKERLGDEFTGVVVDVTKAGLMVELDDYFVDGLLPFRDLDGDPGRKAGGRSPRGRRRRKLFDLGDRIRVILVSCDPVLQRMGLAPAPDAEMEEPPR
ncbi:MAG: ribonuclease R [Candidatus Aminicenantales bacterium]